MLGACHENKEKKMINRYLRKLFNKQQLLVYKKYPRLMGYNIPYELINRAYKRYLKNIDKLIEEHQYPSYWFFGRDRDKFSLAIKTYIVSTKDQYHYQTGIRGYTNMQIAKISGLDKYIDKNLNQM